MTGQQPSGNPDEVVVMYCPSCGVGVQDRAEHFMREYLCPECGKPGYFRHNPPLMSEPEDPQQIVSKQQIQAPDPVEPAHAALAAETGSPLRSGAVGWKIAAATLIALGLGGVVGWQLTVGQQKRTELAQENARKLQLENEYHARLVAVLALRDQAAKIKGLQDLRAALAGSGLAVEKTVTDQLLAEMATAGAMSDQAEREKRAAFQAQENAKMEARLRDLTKSVESRQQELTTREQQAEQTLALQQAVAAREKLVAEKEKQQEDITQRLQAIESALIRKTADNEAKETALKAQQQQLLQAQTATQQELARLLAEQQTAASRAAQQPVVIVKEPAPLTTTYIVRETTPVPVYINTWSLNWGWGSKPRPVYIPPRPTPFPGPGPRPPHH